MRLMPAPMRSEPRLLISRCADTHSEMYNVSRADRWIQQGGRGAEVRAVAGASGVQRQDKEVAVWRAAVPGERIRTCPRSQPPSSQQQGYEPPLRPLPLQLKVCLGVKLRHNKTRGALTLSPQQPASAHTFIWERRPLHTSKLTLSPWQSPQLTRRLHSGKTCCLRVSLFVFFFYFLLFSKNELHPRWIYYLFINT